MSKHLFRSDELASEEVRGTKCPRLAEAPSRCQPSKPSWKSRLHPTVAQGRLSTLRSGQKLASCSAKVVVRLFNTIDLVMLWGWFDVASAETRLPSLLGLLELNFCL
jgi:hypothetical protein